MVFSDLFFLFVFIPAFAILYIIGSLIDKKWLQGNPVQNCRVRNWVLIMFSLIFYSWGEPVYVFLMIFSVFLNYLAGMVIDKQKRHRKAALVLGLIANIAIICIFKYLGFFAQTLNDIGIHVSVPTIALPIGISFYTFQSISYLIDVYRKQSPAQHNYFNLLLYISMFPQLIAGPIVRYSTVQAEIKKRTVSSDDMAEGIFRFLCGLGKKVIIANQLGEVADQFLKNGLADITTTGAWIGAVAFTLQIYFDFSGYSDMAIGLGRCMGFHFNENFDHPLVSKTVTEFWRRWHISLGTFFRDYVYIPMGGNRRHQMLNIFTVWFLTGMWHGASWNFIIWGLYYGILLVIEKHTILKVIDKIPAFLLHVYNTLIVVIGFGIFYFTDFTRLKQFLKAFFGQTEVFHNIITTTAFTDRLLLWIMAIILVMPVRQWLIRRTDRLTMTSPGLNANIKFATKLIVSAAILIVSVALLVGATNNAFLYTRF